MFYVNKSDKDDVIELISSGQGYCIVIDQKDTLEAMKPIGRVLKYSKKEFKKRYKKLKDNHKLIQIPKLNEEDKAFIIEEIERDKIGILQYTEDYVERKKHLDYQEDTLKLKKMSKKERDEYLKEFMD